MASKTGRETLFPQYGGSCVPKSEAQVEYMLLAMGAKVRCENIYCVYYE